LTGTSRFLKGFRPLVFQVVTLSLIGSLLTVLPFRHWLLEINRNLWFYYLAFHLFSLFLLFIVRGYQRAKTTMLQVCLLAGMSLYYASHILPFYFPPEERRPKEAAALETIGETEPITFLYVNVLTENKQWHKVRELIRRTSPDVIVFLEISDAWTSSLDLRKLYPSVIEIPRRDNFGIGLYSRFPFKGEPVTHLGDLLPPVIVQDLEVGGSPLTIAAFHAMPPLGSGLLELNKLTFRRFAALLREKKGDLIVAGDFTATPFSPYYKSFMYHVDLFDARHGFGLSKSWSGWGSWLQLTIDHVMYRGNLRVSDFKTLPDVGSDHYPLLVRFERVVK